MGPLDAQVSFFVKPRYNNNLPQSLAEFQQGYFEPHRAPRPAWQNVCILFYFVWSWIFFSIIADCIAQGSRMQCDCGWPPGLTRPGPRQYSPQAEWYLVWKRTQTSPKVPEKQSMALLPTSVSPLPQAQGDVREDTFNPLGLSNMGTCSPLLCSS